MEEKIIPERFRDILLEEKEKRNLTMPELAKELGVYLRTLERWCSKSSPKSPVKLTRYAVLEILDRKERF